MDEVKRGYREAEDVVKETGRELDGHDLGDDIGNAGDEIRKELGNAGDKVRKELDETSDDVTETLEERQRRIERERELERQGSSGGWAGHDEDTVEVVTRKG